LGGLIGAFKTVSTKHINQLRNTEGQIVWQRNYYEHVIRNEKDLKNITDYIHANPLLWEQDNENPSNITFKG
jgi:REP element-mobilizing transposase RayT